MKPRYLEEKTNHIDALSDAVARLDRQLQQTLENEQHEMIDHLSIDELKRIWEPAAEGSLTRWSQIRPDWPDRPCPGRSTCT